MAPKRGLSAQSRKTSNIKMLRAAFLARVYHFRVPFAIASETLPLYKGMFRHFIIDGLHTLLRKRTGILDFLSALAVGLAMQHAARAEMLLELRVFRIVGVLGLLFRIEVIEVAEELIESMQGRQELVFVAAFERKRCTLGHS